MKALGVVTLGAIVTALLWLLVPPDAMGAVGFGGGVAAGLMAQRFYPLSFDR